MGWAYSGAITPCKTLVMKLELGGLTLRWAYTPNFTVHVKLVFTVGKRLDSKCRKGDRSILCLDMCNTQWRCHVRDRAYHCSNIQNARTNKQCSIASTLFKEVFRFQRWPYSYMAALCVMSTCPLLKTSRN